MIDPQENDKVAGLLGGLNRVNAPANFESRVRARIAEGEQPQTSWLPAFLKIAIPAAGLATIAIAFYFAGIFSRGVEQMKAEDVKAPGEIRSGQSAKEVPFRPTDSNIVAPQQQYLPQNNLAVQGDPNVNSPRSKGPKIPGANVSAPSKSNGGSIDFAQPVGPPDKMPPGFQTVPKPADPKTAPTRPSVPATDFLLVAGVHTEARGGELYVTSVAQNSPAERWGVKAGDTIEALNNNNVNANSEFPSGVNLSAIRVRRNGSSVNLKL